jgi:MerR family transcriptional regulator/heat shock protein HspR
VNIDHEPVYLISIAARLLGCHEQTLRMYERAGLLRPARSGGNTRLYSQLDIERGRRIQQLTGMGVNLAGVQMIFQLVDQMNAMREEMEREMEHLREEVEAQVAAARRRGRVSRRGKASR